MTEQEANNMRSKNLNQIIETLKSLISVFEKMATPRHQLKRIRWSLACAIECVQKQIPMKPKGIECPYCSATVVVEVEKYCPTCGQRLEKKE